MKNEGRFCIAMPLDLIKWLEEVADRRGSSKSAVAREILMRRWRITKKEVPHV